MKYSTLLFDLDDTLLDFGKAEDRAIRLIMEKYNVPITDENIKLYVSMNKALWKQLEKKEITRQQLFDIRFRDYFKAVGSESDGNKANTDYISFLSQGHFLLDGALETCQELYGHYDMYIITNGAKKAQEGRLSNSPLMNYIKGVFISEVIGFVKPERAYFDYVFEHIKEKEKSRVLVVGDSLSSDIAGGTNYGLDTCWINSGKHIPNEATYEIQSISDILKVLNT